MSILIYLEVGLTMDGAEQSKVNIYFLPKTSNIMYHSVAQWPFCCQRVMTLTQIAL